MQFVVFSQWAYTSYQVELSTAYSITLYGYSFKDFWKLTFPERSANGVVVSEPTVEVAQVRKPLFLSSQHVFYHSGKPMESSGI